MSRARVFAAARLAIAAIVAGCGGESNLSSPAASPAPAYEPGYPAGSAGGAIAPAPQATASTALPAPGAPEAKDALVRAHVDLDESERELETSAGDCAAACRALASMERATARLCALADQPDDRRRCDDAKRKVYAGRDRVRQTCNSCPGGPSLDPGAPIPSTAP